VDESHLEKWTFLSPITKLTTSIAIFHGAMGFLNDFLFDVVLLDFDHNNPSLHKSLHNPLLLRPTC
jgi:hypothetical protein